MRFSLINIRKQRIRIPHLLHVSLKEVSLIFIHVIDKSKSKHNLVSSSMSHNMSRRNLCCKFNSCFIKVNCDASIRGNDFIGVGFVVCTDKWNLKGAGVDCVEENFTIDVAEAMTIQYALGFV